MAKRERFRISYSETPPDPYQEQLTRTPFPATAKSGSMASNISHLTLYRSTGRLDQIFDKNPPPWQVWRGLRPLQTCQGGGVGAGFDRPHTPTQIGTIFQDLI